MVAPKKVLITGSSGYVGQHLIASFGLGGVSVITTNDSCDNSNSEQDQQYELFCAYNSLPTFENDLNQLLESSPLHPSISGIRPIPNIDFSQPDYIDVIQQAICGDVDEGEGVDAIIHLAALSSPFFCEKNAEVAWKVNVPVDLLKLNAPIIYMSTDQVYEGTKQFYEEDVDETVPVNIYGRTKLAFERVLLRSDNKPLLTDKELGGSTIPTEIIKSTTHYPAGPPKRSVILRSSLILGPQTPFKNGCRKGFPSFLQFIESRLKSSTPTDYFVDEFRSVVHIDDVIEAIKHFLLRAVTITSEDDDDDDDDESKDEENETRVYNLGGSTRASRYDIALEVARHLKLDSSSANAVNRPENGGGVPSPPDISMNVDKLTKELLGYGGVSGVSKKMSGLKEIVVSTFE